MPPRRRSPLARPLLAVLAFAGLSASAAAEGYYDAYGNWVELPPRQRIYRAPPVYAAPPDDGGPVIVYAEPPPFYDEAPIDPPEHGWGRRVLVPDDAPAVPRGYRLLRRGELPPEFRDDPEGLAIAPDDQADPPVTRRLEQRRQALRQGAAPDDLRPPDDWTAAPSAPARSEARILHVDPDLATPGAPALRDGPEILRPAPEQRAGVDLTRALAALSVYAPAKKAAVKRDDPGERNAAMKQANAWLVTASALPATPATIRALDKLLGIPVDKDSTALPGAGTSVERPKVGKPADVSALGGRLAAYAEARARSGAAAPLMFGDGGRKLETDELAGLDLFLGIRAGDTAVAEKAAP